MKSSILISFFVILSCTSYSFGGLIYVDASAIGSNNGSSWGNAYVYLQDGLGAAVSGDEVWVAAGVYKPDLGVGITAGTRSVSFAMKTGVTVYGGFPSGGGDMESRNPSLNQTILSGDLSGNDGPNFANYAENSYHVVFGNGVNSTAVLNGFVIKGGNANTSPNDTGGGMYNVNCQAIIEDCTFTANRAYMGGGITNISASDTTMRRCTISGNKADMMGGGMRNAQSSPSLSDCLFENNDGYTYGGAIHALQSNMVVKRCVFRTNTVPYSGNGGGVYSGRSSSKFIDCMFIDNNASNYGGAICSSYYEYPVFFNCLFVGNHAYYAGGAAFTSEGTFKFANCLFSGNKTENPYSGIGGALQNDYLSTVTISNCTFYRNSSVTGGAISSYWCTSWHKNSIFWGNTATNGKNFSVGLNANVSTDYCNIQGGTGGTYITDNGQYHSYNSLDCDPQFADANGPDGTAGTADDNLHIKWNSCCIDAAGNSNVMADAADLDGDGNMSEPIPYDLDGRARILDGDCNSTQIVDMGAFEFSYMYLGDFYGGCNVDFVDFAVLASAWLTTKGEAGWNGNCDIALPADGIINEKDLEIFADNWLLGK